MSADRLTALELEQAAESIKGLLRCLENEDGADEEREAGRAAVARIETQPAAFEEPRVVWRGVTDLATDLRPLLDQRDRDKLASELAPAALAEAEARGYAACQADVVRSLRKSEAEYRELAKSEQKIVCEAALIGAANLHDGLANWFASGAAAWAKGGE